MDVGFIGLGRMGSAMARNIAKAGHRVRVWNRSPAAAQALVGVEVVASARDAFQAEVVFTMLADDNAIRAVLLAPDVLRHAPRGVVHVVAATISIAFAEELRLRHEQAGIGYVSAPVFGRPDVAEAAQLNIVAAGDPAVIAKVQPLFDAVGKKTFVLGQDPKQANAAKIAGNMMIAMAIEAMTEAVALTGHYGVTPQTFIDLMLGTLFGGSRVYENYGAKIVKRDFEPGFSMKLGLKDLGLVAAAAEAAGRRLPMLEAVRARMAEAVAAGLGEKDWSAIADDRADRSK